MKKLIVVTGGTKGIGKAIIEKFASDGFTIVTCARNENDLQSLKTTIEQNNPDCKMLIKQADLSKKNEVKDFVNFIQDTGLPVEILINNSGIFVPGMIHEEPEGTLENMMDINLFSAYHLTRGLIGEMKNRKHGYIFNMCSTASIKAYPNGGAYCITKFAMLGMTKVLREEMKEHNVKVTAVLPGPTYTASWEGVDLPEERFVKPEDVASTVYNTYYLSDRAVVEELLIRPQEGDL